MILRSYRRVWKIEKKIYGIQNIRFPVPVEPRQAGYFVVILLAVLILDKVFPFLAAIPSIIKYLAIPYLLTRFLLKKKLDGKPPQKFFFDYLAFLANRSGDIEFFRKSERGGGEVIKLNWECSSRNA